jgi:hypothetical protein
MRPLCSPVPQFIEPNETASEILSSFCLSSIMHSIVSFELDDACVLPSIFYDRALYFPESNQITHIRITLYYFDYCVTLLKQIGSQLYSFNVTIANFDNARFLRIYQIPTVRNISLFEILLKLFVDFLSKFKIFVNDNLSKFC